jgi:hypothetical protein
MANRDLIPEARADKNGNVVTRWVRSVFGGNNSSRDIPTPSLGAQAPTHNPKKELVQKWKSALSVPPDYEDDYLPRWVQEAIEGDDIPLLQLVEKFGDKCRPEAIHVLLSHMRNKEQGEAAHLVTEAHLEAATIMDRRFPRAHVNPMDENELFPAIREETLRRYVMDAPESAHQVEELISRGIRDPEVILTTLTDLQGSKVAVPLNDGIL